MERKTLSVTIKFSPNIYSNIYLNNASQATGAIERDVVGHTKQQLFENIREKIWALSSEVIILDDKVAEEYNRWIAGLWNRLEPPAEITNVGMRDCRYALPYSSEFKAWLRKHG